MKRKLVMVASWFAILFCATGIAGFILQGTGANDTLGYISIGTFTVAMALWFASVFFNDVPHGH